MGNREFHYLPKEHYLQVAQGAAAKVAPDGVLLPFYGSTVIYDLDESAKNALKQLQTALYDRCGKLLSEPLTEQSFHVTLHDLISGTDRDAVLVGVNELRESAEKAVEEVKTFLRTPVPMKPVKLVSMVGTSVVLLLEPVYPVHEQLLKVAYERLQKLVNLSYGLTPHVTLGYYRPGTIVGDDLNTLAQTLSDLTDGLDFTLQLDARRLEYCEFRDMNTYVKRM